MSKNKKLIILQPQKKLYANQKKAFRDKANQLSQALKETHVVLLIGPDWNVLSNDEELKRFEAKNATELKKMVKLL